MGPGDGQLHPPGRRPGAGGLALAQRVQADAIKTELEYELRELREDGMVFVGTNKTATSTDRIDVVPHPDGARITYDATVEFNGAAKFADPLMHLVFLKLARDTVRDLTRTLERI